MEDNEKKEELTEDEIKQIQLAYKIAKEVVEELQFKDSEEYVKGNFDKSKDSFFTTDNGYDIKVFAHIISGLGNINIQFSLTLIANDLIGLFRLILSDETAPSVLQNSVIYELRKRNIDMLTLFGLEESEVDEVIETRSKEVLKMFLPNISLFARSAIVDAYAHTKIGYIQNFLKPLFKEDWEKLGLPNDFNIIIDDDLEKIRQYNLDRKKWFLGDKKQLLNLETLGDDADKLRIRYKEAKSFFIEYKRSFNLINPRSTDEELKEKWVDIQIEKFPDLHFKALDLIESLRPYELALTHLAEIYDYDEESMRKKVTQSRKLKKNQK